MLNYWIWLATRRNLRDQVKVELIRAFGDPESVFYARSDEYKEIEGITKGGAKALADKNLSPAEQILEECREKGIRILTWQDEAYPARLRSISDPPLVLYYTGNLPDFDGEPLIGIVGTRSATPYGMNVAKRMGYQISKCGGTVVSGMATGIDSMAMWGALTAGAGVIGILGCGVDIVYPRSNKELFADTRHYGCIMSEFPPGTPPVKQNFPRRNRIISGIACGVLVVEAPEKSGALITARQAADQGRDVFVVPGNIDMPSCVGSNRLMRDGAIPVSTGWDVLSEYQALYPDKISEEMTLPRRAFHGGEIPKNLDGKQPMVAQKPEKLTPNEPPKGRSDKKVIDNGENSPYIDLNDILTKLPRDEAAVAAVVGNGQKLVDDVIAQVGMPAGKVLAALTMLEIKGVLCRLPGRYIALNKGKQ